MQTIAKTQDLGQRVPTIHVVVYPSYRQLQFNIYETVESCYFEGAFIGVGRNRDRSRDRRKKEVTTRNRRVAGNTNDGKSLAKIILYPQVA
jgi:hypothetical protein